MIIFNLWYSLFTFPYFEGFLEIWLFAFVFIVILNLCFRRRSFK